MEEILNIIQEIWKPIINYEGLYEISNYGRVKRFNRDKKRRPFKIRKLKKYNKYGHLSINLCKESKVKIFQAHRLVLEAFVGPCPPGMEGCHNNGNPSDNFVGNLRYDTHKNNIHDKIKHNTDNKGSKHNMAILNDIKVLEILKLLEKGELTHKKIAARYNVSRHTITKINNKKIWRHLHG